MKKNEKNVKKMFNHLTGSSINEHLATILVGLVQLVSNIAALFVVDRSGRKPLLMISAIVKPKNYCFIYFKSTRFNNKNFIFR